MIKRIIYAFFTVVGLLILSYILQPVKKGKGYDASTQYKQVKDWLHLPAGLSLGDPTGIGIDRNQNIVIFHRAGREWPLFGSMPDQRIQEKTVLIIDNKTGKVIKSWGDNIFIMPHGLTVDHENNIWLTDVGLHQVFKFSHDGKLLLQLGEATIPGDDSLHFNKPTDVTVAKDGSFYVSDGYGNSRIIKFSPTGNYLLQWGKAGRKGGKFNIPHGISLDNTGNVYVADRENDRIQVFDSDGKFIKQLTEKSFGAICSVAFDKKGEKLYAVDDFSFLKIKHRGSDVFVFDGAGKVQTRFGRSGSFEGSPTWYHDLAIDNEENVYVCDLLGNSIQKFRRIADR